MRLSGRAFIVLLAIVGLLVVAATDQVLPATSEHQAQTRIWLAARAAGITAYLLLTFQVVLGLVLSHPTNQSTWRLSKLLFPWHENAWVFVLAFLGAHVVAIIVDPWAGVGIGGAIVPGLSSYRSSAVALGTLSLYALLITGMSARYTKRLPAGVWLKIHRLALVVFVLGWLHGVLAGTDATGLLPLYVVSGVIVAISAAYRYWIVRRARQTPARREPAQREPAPREPAQLEPVPVTVEVAAR